jgi:hypothetical protein
MTFGFFATIPKKHQRFWFCFLILGGFNPENTWPEIRMLPKVQEGLWIGKSNL